MTVRQQSENLMKNCKKKRSAILCAQLETPLK